MPSGCRVAHRRPPISEDLLSTSQNHWTPPAKNSPARCYPLTGNEDDRVDSYALAEVLRTYGRRLTPLSPGGAQTLTLRWVAPASTDLVPTRITI